MHQTGSSSLREALRDPNDHDAWNEFCQRYRPLILAFATRLGMGHSDAEDVAQDTLSGFLVGFRRGDYDPRKGRLRSWLLGIARNKVLYLRRQQAHQRQVPQESGTNFFDRVPDDDTVNQIWEAEWQRHIVQECLSRLRAQFNTSSIQAFELVTLQECPTEQVAERLGMSANAVLKANRRVLSRLRELQEFIEQDW